MPLERFKRRIWSVLSLIGSAALVFHALLLIAVEGKDLRRAAKAPSPTELPARTKVDPENPALDAAFRLLGSVDATAAKYLRIHDISILMLPAAEYARRYSIGSIAQTEDRRHIFVNQAIQADTVLLAAVLAHESVHIRHGDIGDPAAHHLTLYHVFWQSEEDEAHAAGLRVLRALGHGQEAIHLEGILLLIRPLHGPAAITYSVLFLILLWRELRRRRVEKQAAAGVALSAERPAISAAKKSNARGQPPAAQPAP